jgi:hypothetical protein
LGIGVLHQSQFRIGKVERCVFVRFIDRLGQLTRPVPLQPRVAGVADNREQPGPALAAAIAAKKLESSQIGFLHDIFGVLIVAHQPACQVVCGGQMRQRHFFKANRAALFCQIAPRP